MNIKFIGHILKQSNELLRVGTLGNINTLECHYEKLVSLQGQQC